MASSFQTNGQYPKGLRPGAEKYFEQEMGYSSGNTSNSPLLNLAQSWQDAQDKANKANDDRYNNIVAGYQDNHNQAMQSLDKSGKMQKMDVGEAFDKRASDVKAGAVSRGLSNTTVRDTMLTGNEKERLKAMNRVEEQLNDQRLGYQTSLKNALLQFMERRDDNAPDFGQLLQMAQLMGAGGMGGNQALQYGGGNGGGYANVGGGGGMGQPYMGDAQFAGMGGYGGPGGFGNWGGSNYGGYSGGGNTNGLNKYQQQLLQQNQQKNQQASDLGLWNWLNGGTPAANPYSYSPGDDSGVNGPGSFGGWGMPQVEQSGYDFNPSDWYAGPVPVEQTGYEFNPSDWYF